MRFAIAAHLQGVGRRRPFTLGVRMVRKLVQYAGQLLFAATFGWPGVVAVRALAIAAVVFVHPMNGAQRLQVIRALACRRR